MPLHVLTGFLGSGKTAVVRALIEACADPHRGATDRERIAVLVNEVGELGLDHHLLERVDEDVLMLAGGCVCCAVRDDLHAALDRIRALSPSRIVLETTGLADPGPLLHTVATDPRLSQMVELAGVVAVVDCLRVQDLFDEHPEVRAQLDFADRVLLTKTDLAPAQRTRDVEAFLAREVPGRGTRTADHGVVDPGWLLSPAGYAADEDGSDGTRGWLRRPHDHAHDTERHTAFSTHVLHHDTPTDLERLELWLRLVAQIDGTRLLRVKGIVRDAGTGGCYALQSAGRSVSPPLRLSVAPAGLSGAEFVLIERGLSEGSVVALLQSLRDALAGHRPADRREGDRPPPPQDADCAP